jgi:hypothetical protein
MGPREPRSGIEHRKQYGYLPGSRVRPLDLVPHPVGCPLRGDINLRNLVDRSPREVRIRPTPRGFCLRVLTLRRHKMREETLAQLSIRSEEEVARSS